VDSAKNVVAEKMSAKPLSMKTAAAAGSWPIAMDTEPAPIDSPDRPILSAAYPVARSQFQAPMTSCHSSMPPAQWPSCRVDSPWLRRSGISTPNPLRTSIPAGSSEVGSRRQEPMPWTTITTRSPPSGGGEKPGAQGDAGREAVDADVLSVKPVRRRIDERAVLLVPGAAEGGRGVPAPLVETPAIHGGVHVPGDAADAEVGHGHSHERKQRQPDSPPEFHGAMPSALPVSREVPDRTCVRQRRSASGTRTV
jgi:hypothetical protein